MLHLYHLFIPLYYLAVRLAALWNKKAAAWVKGRKNVFEYLHKNTKTADRFIWVHCSSAGEFEQGKPVIEALKSAYPAHKILLTFFSPSGYEVAKNYALADLITYLPLDTKKNAERFFRLVRPELVIFVKYEFWYHHLSVAAFHHVPILLISAVFRKDQVFFQRYGGFFRQMLYLFRHIFVQDASSLELLQASGITHCSISGDTRFDRVVAITENTTPIPFIDEFAGGKKLIVAGSTWSGDDEVLADYLAQCNNLKLVIAPHEINNSHITTVQALFPESLLYSDLTTDAAGKEKLARSNVLIINCVGLLSRLYRHATITYVGGGYTKDGIHNILEAAVWGKPVLFGPNYHKYREGREMIQSGAAFSFTTADELKRLADDLLGNENHLQQVSLKARTYVTGNTGATGKVIAAIQEKRLLTN